MSFEVKILGSSSAIPAFGRNHSAQIVSFFDKLFLIDCGEGTQIQLRRYRIKSNKINAIFISHLHGDHFLGLFGLISSMSLLGRTKPLQVFAPKGLDEIITLQLKHSGTVINYPLEFIPLPQSSEPTEIFTITNLSVKMFPLKHGVLCNGFRFDETFRPRKIIRELIKDEDFSKTRMRALKQGNDILNSDGDVLYKNKDVTAPSPALRSYSYCSDTAYFDDLYKHVKGSTLLYHETSFLNDMTDRAIKTNHSTTIDAATVAKEAQVRHMIIGHFSGRYSSTDDFLTETTAIFPNTQCVTEGTTYSLGL